MRAFVFASLLLLVHVPLAAQVDWREELRSDQVVLAGGKFTYTESGVMTIAIPGYEEITLQYQINSEAPASGAISRDNFVGMTFQLATMVMFMAFAEGYEVPAAVFLENVDIQETKELIGNPDIRLNLFMTGEGMQVEMIGPDGEPARFTQTWQQVYGKS